MSDYEYNFMKVRLSVAWNQNKGKVLGPIIVAWIDPINLLSHAIL